MGAHRIHLNGNRVTVIVDEIACALCECGNIGDPSDSRSAAKALIVQEIECFVLDDRSSERPPELIQSQRRFAEAQVIEVVSRVEHIVTEEFIDGSVQVVGP